MKIPLRVLHLEDDLHDAELVREELIAGGFACEVVAAQTEADFRAALEQGGLDLILLDYKLPSFDGLSALALAPERRPGVPVIMVSGSLGDDLAVETLKRGATDYVVKDRLSRLVPVVQRALREAEERAQRRRAEEALRRAEEKYRSIFENAVVGIYQVTPEGRYLLANPTLARMLGYESPEALLETVTDLNRQFYVEPGRRDEFIRQAQEQGSVSHFESQVYRRDGSVIWVSEQARAVHDASGRLACFEGTTVDITDRKRAEEFQARLAAVIEATSDFVGIADMDGRALYLNQGGKKMLGIGDDEDVSSIKISDTHPKWARELVLNEGIPSALRDGIWRGETALLTRYGREIPVLQVIVAPRRPDGTVDFQATIMRDISERKRGEEALRASEERLRNFVEHGVVGMYQTTPDGRTLMANPALLRMLGYASFEEAEQENLEAMSREGRYPQRPLFMATIERDGVVTGFESTWTTRDGKTLHVRESGRCVRDVAGNVQYYEGTVEDLTATKQLEDQLRQAQKLEAVGRLAGGIAHDFNNLLQALLSTVQALRHAAHDERESKRFAELEEHIHRGAQLTRQLLLFSRREKPSPQWLDLNELLRDSVKMLRRLLRANIRLDLQLADQPVVVEADRGQLDQVLMNLVVNASDAMPEGGTLAIRSGTEGSDAVFFAVTDTGGGIPAEIRDRIFEPFFTTKGAGRGTGLGLAVVHGIVSEHGGRLEVESEGVRGTTFRVVLPHHPSGEYAAVKEEAAPQPELPPGHGERILVVEDERAACEGLREILAMLGYDVVTAASAEEAGRLPGHPPFHVLVTDLMLPGASGTDLAAGLRERWPDLKVILMSGYTEDEALRRGAAEGSMRFLQKPFDMETLAREVRAALAER